MAKTKTSAKKKAPSLNEAAAQLIKMAEEGGVEQNFFFVTTFERYKTQLNTLSRLQEAIESDDVLVSKEYVKGRPNIVSNPAITEYNKTATAANQTVTTLIKIITTFADGSLMGGGSSGSSEDCDL